MGIFNTWPTSKPKDLIEKVFRVESFDRNNTTYQNGKIKAKSLFQPYGYLTVESPDSKNAIRIPIIHKDDFSLALLFFDDPASMSLKNQHIAELLVTYAPAEADKNGFSTSSFHCLHYAICAYGTIDKFYDKPDSNSTIFGEYAFEGLITIKNHFSS